MTAIAPRAVTGVRFTAGRRRRWLRYGCLLLAFVFLDQLVIGAYWIYAMSASDYPPVRGDAAVVLFAGLDDAGQPNPESMRRLTHARELLDSGRVAALICVGGSGVDARFTGAWHMREFLLAQGVRAEAVIVGGGSRETRGNLASAAAAAKARGWRDLVLVTSPIHTPRMAYFAARDPRVRFRYSPYREGAGRPPMDIWQYNLWLHHELVGWAIWGLLPESTYDKLLIFLRSPG